MQYGQLFIVGLPIGNIEDITIRAINILKSVNLILCEDTREFIKISSKYDIKTKVSSFHNFNENEKTEYILNLLKSGQNIALTSDRGTPCISDPGFFLVKEYTKFLNFNISQFIVPIPGASSVITSVSMCSFDGKFLFWGFAQEKHLESLVNAPVPIVFFEAPHRINTFFKMLYKFFGNREVFIAKEITKIYENFTYTYLENLEIKDPKGEFVIIVKNQNNSSTINIKEIEKICALNINISNKDLCALLYTIYNTNKSEIYSIINEKRTNK